MTNGLRAHLIDIPKKTCPLQRMLITLTAHRKGIGSSHMVTSKEQGKAVRQVNPSINVKKEAQILVGLMWSPVERPYLWGRAYGKKNIMEEFSERTYQAF